MYRLPELKKPAVFTDWGNVSRDLRGTQVGDVWYVLEGASVVFGIDASIRATFFEPDGTVNVGVFVCNQRSDGKGEALPSEGGTVQFNISSQSNFSPPAGGPHAIFCAKAVAVGEFGHLTYNWLRSDVISGLGNYLSEHSRIALKFRGIVLREQATIVTREDAIRDEAYQKSGKGAFYNLGAALQNEARKAGLGAVLTDEFTVQHGVDWWEAQGFAGGIMATRLGRYAAENFFIVEW